MLLTDYIEKLRVKIVTEPLYYDDIDNELAKLQTIVKDASVYIPYCESAVIYAHVWLEWCKLQKINIFDEHYTDKNLEKAFKNTVLPPKPFMYNHIRWTVEEIISDNIELYEGNEYNV